jgi:hypothetical protein
MKFSINIHESNAPAGSPAAQAAQVAILGRGRRARAEPGWSIRTLSSFEWLIGECDSLQSVLDRVAVPGVAPRITGLPPDATHLTITEQRDFVPLDHIYPNVAPVAATVVAALRAGAFDLTQFEFITERRCLKRIASLSHSLCTDLQMLNGTIYARDVPKHRCVNYGSVGHQFGKLCTTRAAADEPAADGAGGASGGVRQRSEFFQLTQLNCGPHRLLVASEVDCLTADGQGVELKIGKLGGARADGRRPRRVPARPPRAGPPAATSPSPVAITRFPCIPHAPVRPRAAPFPPRPGLSTWTQCLFADVPIVVRGTSREIAAGVWRIQAIDMFNVREMLSDSVKERAMATFARVLTRLRQTMREGRVYRLQREQRNIVCFELPEPIAPLITEAEIDWLKAQVRSEQAAAAERQPRAPAAGAASQQVGGGGRPAGAEGAGSARRGGAGKAQPSGGGGSGGGSRSGVGGPKTQGSTGTRLHKSEPSHDRS